MAAKAIPLHARDGSVRCYALVDLEDFEQLAQHRWSFDASTGYAVRHNPRDGGERQPLIRLHREIMGLVRGDGLEVDHINRDRLDNRRVNLRVVTRHEQMQNYPAIGGTSRFRGVSWDRRKARWRANCQKAGKQHFLGYHASEEAAHAAASAFRREHMPFSTEGSIA